MRLLCLCVALAAVVHAQDDVPTRRVVKDKKVTLELKTTMQKDANLDANGRQLWPNAGSMDVTTIPNAGDFRVPEIARDEQWIEWTIEMTSTADDVFKITYGTKELLKVETFVIDVKGPCKDGEDCGKEGKAPCKCSGKDEMCCGFNPFNQASGYSNDQFSLTWASPRPIVNRFKIDVNDVKNETLKDRKGFGKNDIVSCFNFEEENPSQMIYNSGSFACILKYEGDEYVRAFGFRPVPLLEGDRIEPRCQDDDNCIEGDECSATCEVYGYPLDETNCGIYVDKGSMDDYDYKPLDRLAACDMDTMSVSYTKSDTSGAFRVLACDKEQSRNCIERAFRIRMRPANALLWPLFGIIIEAILLAVIIFFCEKKRKANLKKEAGFQRFEYDESPEAEGDETAAGKEINEQP